MCGAVTENNENGQSEPEMDADTTGGDPGEGMGELADAMQVTVYCCTTTTTANTLSARRSLPARWRT